MKRGLFVLMMLLLAMSSVQAQRKTLTIFWASSPSTQQSFYDMLDRFVSDYEAMNPEINIEIDFVDTDIAQQALNDRIMAGNPPDLAQIPSRWVPAFVAQGMIEPLDHYITSDFRRLFVPAIINEGAVYQGRTFGLPIATSTRAMYYNRDLFEQAGIEAPPETWDELLEVGRAIHALDDDIYGFGFQGGGGTETNTYFYYFVWGNDGDLYNVNRTESALNSPEAVEALEYVMQLIEAGATQPEPASSAYDRRRPLEDLFQQGRLGMVISGTWFINRLRDQAPDIRFGVAPIPYNTTPATYGVMDALVMLSASRQKDDAWQFMEFFYEPERREEYALVGGYLPEMRAVAESELFQADPDFSVFLSLLPEARFEPLHIQSETIAQIVIGEIQAVYLKQTDPQTALDAAANSINRLLDASTAGW